MADNKQEASEGAMQAAEEINLYIVRARALPYNESDLATIIDRHTRPEWIKCSERMPTREDGDDGGYVMWLHSWGQCVGKWDELLEATAWFAYPRPLPLPPDPEVK